MTYNRLERAVFSQEYWQHIWDLKTLYGNQESLRKSLFDLSKGVFETEKTLLDRLQVLGYMELPKVLKDLIDWVYQGKTFQSVDFIAVTFPATKSMGRDEIWLQLLSAHISNIVPRKQGHVIKVVEFMQMLVAGDLEGMYATFSVESQNTFNKDEYLSLIRQVKSIYDGLSPVAQDMFRCLVVFHDVGALAGGIVS